MNAMHYETINISPDGTRVALLERTASLSSSCCANSSMVAIVSTRTGVVHPVPAARLETQEDAGWILWLPGGNRLLAGALLYSYAVDAQTYTARPFFFYPQKAEGPDAEGKHRLSVPRFSSSFEEKQAQNRTRRPAPGGSFPRNRRA